MNRDNSMNCHVCGKGPADGISVYRINEKGVPGICACERHIDPKLVDPETRKIVKILEDRK
jgi:hypothetical protein